MADSNPRIHLDNPFGEIYTSLCAPKKPYLYLHPPTALDAASRQVNASTTFKYQGTLALPDDVIFELFAQPIAFCAGTVDVLIVDALHGSPVHDAVSRVTAQLSGDQVPRFHWLETTGTAATHDAVKSLLGTDGILVTNRPDDWCVGLPMLVDPYVQYKLESKLILHESPIPSPDGEVIWLDGESWHELETKLRARSLPFIVKITHAGGGQGIFTARDGPSVDALVASLKTFTASQNLNVTDGRFSSTSTSTGSALPILITDLLTGPTYTIVFSITHDAAKPVIHGVMEQVLAPNGTSWQGVLISYSAQSALASRYADLMRTTARYMHAEGFRGLAAIDFLHDDDGAPKVVDLNPRFGGAAPLCLVRSHFTKRGCDVVYLTTYRYPGRKDDAERILDKLDGVEKLVLSVTQVSEGMTMMLIFVGGRDREHARLQRDRVLEGLGLS